MGLICSSVPGKGRGAGQPAALAKEFQIVHHEVLAHLADKLVGAGHDRLHICALLRHIGGFQHDEPLAQGSAAAIQHAYVTVGVALAQLLAPPR